MGARVFGTSGLTARTSWRFLLEAWGCGGRSSGDPAANLSHLNFAIGGGMQLFLESGTRQKGFYLLGDLTFDRESFTAEYDSSGVSGAIVPLGSREVWRLGGAVGLGWIARNGMTLELGYHRSLTGAHDIKGTFNSASNHFFNLPRGQSFRFGLGYTWGPREPR